jgi:hypothetical protein
LNLSTFSLSHLLTLGFFLACVSLPAHPERRASAERHRALVYERLPVERWFVPGELGHELGKAPSTPGEGAFRIRSIIAPGPGLLGEWARRNQLTQRRGQLHNLAYIFHPQLFDAHPEFFPLVDGERWRPPDDPRLVAWQPDLAEPAAIAHAADYARRYFSENPEAWWVRLGTNDGLIFGDSEGVREWTYPPRWFRRKPDYSDLVFQFMNQVAEAVSPDWPERHFGQLAYYWTENAPSFPLHPKIVPFLATDQSQLYDADYRAKEWDLKERWGEAGPERMGLSDYLYGNGFLIPRQHLPMVAEHIRHARSVGFTDYHGLAGFNWGLDGPQPWAVTQLLLDPFQPLEPLLAEYYRRYFRAAADPMRQFFEECERIWREQPGAAYWLKHFRNESQAELFPSHVNRRLRTLLDEAAARVRHDPVASARVELTSAAFSVTEAFARFHEARQALSSALMEWMEESDPDHLQALLEAYVEAREGQGAGGSGQGAGNRVNSGLTPGFLPTWKRVQQNHPLAMSRTNLDVYLMNDPGPTAAALLDQRVGAGAVRHPVVPDLAWDLSADLTGGVEIAGLTYRLDMPPGWSARVEPFEGATAEFESGITDYGLEIMNTEDAVSSVNHNSKFIIHNQKRLEAWHWLAVPADALGLASIEVRGSLGPSSFLLLRASWVDADQQFVGEDSVVRLHEGTHPGGKRLRLLLDPPEGAVFMRYRLNVFHMMPGDWLEMQDPRVEWFFR